MKIKGQKEAATQEYDVYGWKVLVLIEVQTRLPLAIQLVKIQDYEGKWLLPLLKQAQDNLGEYGQIGTVVIDRGYLDGEDLWHVGQQDLIFVICAKSHMTVTQDAQALAKGEPVRSRERVVRHGHGKSASDERLRTELVGVEALTSYDQYGDAQQTQYAHPRDYVGQPINVVVVRTWDNRPPKTEGTVSLTNASVRDPFTVFDTYDWRSVIENGIFKEGKYPWHLWCFPKRTEAAVVVHCHLTLLVMALCTAFRLWQANSTLVPTAQTAVVATLSSALLGGEGTARWRQRLREENRDKIIVFIGQAYDIFHLAEFAILTHLPLRQLPSALGSPQAILHRFGLSPSSFYHNVSHRDLVGPALADTSWSSKEAERFDQSQFSIDWEAKSVLCPAGQKVGIGVICRINTESRVFAYGFLYRSADRAHCMLNVRQFQQKSFFSAQINRAFRHFKKLASVRQHQHFEHSLRNAQGLRARLPKQCARARSEDLALWDSRS